MSTCPPGDHDPRQRDLVWRCRHEDLRRAAPRLPSRPRGKSARPPSARR